MNQALDMAPSWFELDPTLPADVAGAWIICLLTLAVFSFLYRDNPFYKFAEHLFVGVGTAWFAMEFYESGVLKPLIEYLHKHILQWQQPDPGTLQLGGYPVSVGLGVGLRLVAVLLSLMLLTRLFNRHAWAPRWPLALMIGIYAALKMTGETQAKLVSQVKETMIPLARPQDSGLMIFGNLVFLVGLLCVLGHFLFTYRRSRTLAGVSRAGIVILMLTFGSMFGFTVLGRIALLIERVEVLELYSGGDYSLLAAPPPGAPEGGFGWGLLLTPPFLIGAIIIAVLSLSLLRRKPELGEPQTPS